MKSKFLVTQIRFLFSIRTFLGNYSCLKVNLIFTRDRSFYFTTVFIPGIILVTSSFITFWLEWNAVPARSMIGKTFEKKGKIRTWKKRLISWNNLTVELLLRRYSNAYNFLSCKYFNISRVFDEEKCYTRFLLRYNRLNLSKCSTKLNDLLPSIRLPLESFRDGYKTSFNWKLSKSFLRASTLKAFEVVKF